MAVPRQIKIDKVVPVRAPIFIVSSARSGSTLLRYILDAHPLVTCPPETNLSNAVAAINNIWMQIGDADDSEERKEQARAHIRDAVLGPMEWLLARQGKQIWCDKSLTTVESWPAISFAFPEAKFICLYRHCMDFIWSIVDASKWGFNAFGIAGYVGATPENIVGALAAHWIDKASKLRALEDELGDHAFRLYYEMLTQAPEATLKELFEFLDLPWDSKLLKDAFTASHLAGAGDHKIGFTTRIESSSIGRGSTVPQILIPAMYRQALNERLRDLGYPEVEEDWNQKPSPLVSKPPQLPRDFFVILHKITAQLQQLSLEDLPSCSQFGVILEDLGGEASFVVDVAERKASIGSFDKSMVGIITRSEALAQMEQRDFQLGSAIVNGSIRIVATTEQARRVSTDVVNLFLNCIRPTEELAPN